MRPLIFRRIRSCLKLRRLAVGVFLIASVCNLLVSAKPRHDFPSLVSSANYQIDSADLLQETRRLEPDKPLDGRLASTQINKYSADLRGGQFITFELDLGATKAIARILDPSGKVIARKAFDSKSGKLTIEFVAESDGSYNIEIEGKSKDADLQSYTITLKAPRQATEEEVATQQARRLIARSGNQFGEGKYDDAKKSAEKALEISERLKTDQTLIGNSLLNLANACLLKGEFQRAESLYLRSLSIWEKSDAKANIVRVRGNLGALYAQLGDSDKAEKQLRMALEIQTELSGPDDPAVAAALSNLALVYENKGDYQREMELFKQALAIREKTAGPDSQEAAEVLGNLANVYQSLGDYDKAEAMGRSALTILLKKLGREHSRVADQELNLANVLYLSGKLDAAEPLYGEALEVYQKSMGPEHPRVALALNNIAAILSDKRDFANAEGLYERALAIRIKTFGDEHPEVAQTLSALGDLCQDQREFDKAENYYRRSLAVRERVLGSGHPDCVLTLSSLAKLYMAKGAYSDAADFLGRAIRVRESNADLNLLTGSERQKLAYLDLMWEQIHRAITLSVQFAPNLSEARDLALTTILQRKGRVQDTLANNLATLRQRMDSEDRDLLDRYNSVTAKLGELVLEGPQHTSAAEHEKLVSTLRQERENLEADIAKKSAQFKANKQQVSIGAIQGALPDKTALLEFFAYKPFIPTGFTKEQSYGDSRYVVYLIRGLGDIEWKDLGDAKAIDKTVEQLRAALQDPSRRDVGRLSHAVYAKIIQPISAYLADTEHLLISPDSSLNLLPFEALLNENNRYLVEDFSCTYLSTGRDLLRFAIARGRASEPVIFANPSFGEPDILAASKPSDRSQHKATLSNASNKRRKRSITTGSDLTQVYFAPLEGTAEEAREIKSLFPDSRLLVGKEATEASLKQVVAPKIVHIATHGFFLSDTPSGAVVSKRGSPNPVENSLLRAGLALTGANLQRTSDGDGILTALEAAGLNLWGTRLVTLSACDTGIGEVKNGEGVYGLRRAFVLAGTETMVMSLWAVSDFVTRELMSGYYKGLQKGLGRCDALRQTQLAMLRKHGRSHPFYWSSFIQSGDWRPLDAH